MVYSIFCHLARFMSLMQALVQCLDGHIPLVVELESLGDQGVDAASWHAHLGSEGGDLGDELLNHWTLWQTGEWHGLHGQLGLLGLAGWSALGDWDLGKAHLSWALLDEVPQDGALAGGDLVSLGNLGWQNGHLGAHLSFLLKLRQDGWGHHGGVTRWDRPGGNLHLRLRVDTMASDSLSHDWLLEVAADTAQLVLELDGWDNLNDLSVGLDLFQEEPWSLDDHNMVWGHEDLSNDGVINNVLDNDNLADWDYSWFAIDQDCWEGRGWDNLDQILLEDDLGVPDTLLDMLGLDSKPVESGAISSNNNWSNNSGWDVHGIAVELDQVPAMDHAGLGREDRSRDNPGEGDLGSRDWEEQVEWVGNADVAEEDLLGWQNNLQV